MPKTGGEKRKRKERKKSKFGHSLTAEPWGIWKKNNTIGSNKLKDTEF